MPENVPDLGLWDFFHRNTFTKDGTSCQPVIILDQFEEIYTLTDVEHKPEIISLFTELASLLNDIKPDAVLEAESSFTEGTTTSSSSDDDFSFELSTESSFAYNETVSFRFVICLREDKLYLLERNSANIPSIKTNRYNLQALSPESALEVITCPRLDLFTTEEATVIVDKLADMGDEGIRTVDPAILSLFLYKYFEKKGEANYDNIFADYYHEATKGIKDKSLAFLEDHLLTLGGYRNQIPVDDALSSGVSSAEIDSLLKQIILRSEKRKGIDYIEFSHDRLCVEAKKNRNNRVAILQRKKLLQRILLIGMFVSVILFSALWTNIKTASQNKKLEELNENIQQQNTSIEMQKDSLLRFIKNNKLLSDSLATALAEKDSIMTELNTFKEAQEIAIGKLTADVQNSIEKKTASVTSPTNEQTTNQANGQTASDAILTKTVLVKASSSYKYKFSTRGHQELGVVAEAGGRITLRIHVTNSSGLDVWYNDTKKIKEGEQSRKIAFDTPKDKRSVVELEIINCIKKDVSCVVISN